MKPLIRWARARHPQPCTLRIQKRAADAISGEVLIDGKRRPFLYDRQRLTITLDPGPEAQIIQINEWGWEQ